MRRRISYILASMIFAFAAMVFTVAPGTKVGAQGASCQAQCKVSYMKCVAAATNPGGLNQCRKAYQDCLSRCH